MPPRADREAGDAASTCSRPPGGESRPGRGDVERDAHVLQFGLVVALIFLLRVALAHARLLRVQDALHLCEFLRLCAVLAHGSRAAAALRAALLAVRARARGHELDETASAPRGRSRPRASLVLSDASTARATVRPRRAADAFFSRGGRSCACVSSSLEYWYCSSTERRRRVRASNLREIIIGTTPPPQSDRATGDELARARDRERGGARARRRIRRRSGRAPVDSLEPSGR